MFFLQLLPSQKCDKIENIHRFLVILFAYIKKILYFCSAKIYL